MLFVSTGGLTTRTSLRVTDPRSVAVRGGQCPKVRPRLKLSQNQRLTGGRALGYHDSSFKKKLMRNEIQTAAAKQEYQAPVLSEFGSVTELTLAANTAGNSDGTFPSNP